MHAKEIDPIGQLTRYLCCGSCTTLCSIGSGAQESLRIGSFGVRNSPAGYEGSSWACGLIRTSGSAGPVGECTFTCTICI